MADITQLRFAQALKRTFGLKAVDPGRVLPAHVQPTFPVSDVYAPETRLDRGERNFILGAQTTNAVGQFNGWSLQNPVGSGKLSIVKRATFGFNLPTSTNQPGQVFIQVGIPVAGAGTPGGVVGRFKDSRIGGFSTNPTVTLFANPLATSSPSVQSGLSCVFIQLFPAGTINGFSQVQTDQIDLVAGPGSQTVVGIYGDTVPVGAWSWVVLLEGYERVADPAELLGAPS